MTREDVYAKLEPIFRELFDQYNGPITDELTANDVEQWDSLGHVQLVVALEQECGVRCAPQEVTGLPDLGALVDLFAAKTQA
ncbi:hypothetical protein AAJ72_11170 [Citromicrobium sp. RCC1885]|uniref:acyl carrier protein n=1 Tax=unclassified Citromicrobium TaxID=2630544 RepID=UPI0006C8EB6A|nr:MULTISPECIES: acyl carrier protein [unclassified Citromicrobium]MAO03176.1 acyl carrier protein [Citromicrobium sp.]KPM22677.1 hypothetical protein AAJ72_11170 [Citromicrobium sp. RCC1885]KPM26160.1 hypothetical protein AAJ74_11910 [Citromicrobium sp. RCC1878]MAO05921.1 acyl carrier protein [Citromicrobium sp.]OAM08046.1 hypothetical protein A0U43_12260 [Citromicrobium sp. RCC1897]|tara:strand:- start:3158 stop:3403 length:246 start_codon:yes stop_codon:yes gene_type:complete